jgi:hypothetical protein
VLAQNPVRAAPVSQLDRITPMGTLAGPPQDFSLRGEVVEIFEIDGQPRVRIVLRPSAVIDLPAGVLGEVYLGTRVIVDGSIRLTGVRTEADSGTTVEQY